MILLLLISLFATMIFAIKQREKSAKDENVNQPLYKFIIKVCLFFIFALVGSIFIFIGLTFGIGNSM